VAKSEWKKLLPDDLYHIAFEKGTERAFTGKYWDFDGIGTYACAVCGNVLFQADAKFAAVVDGPASSRPNGRTPCNTMMTVPSEWYARR
jgi:peptide-methionine (R)-S-oxide reductase